MGQIQDVIELATSSDSDLESALLRCKVLARRIGYAPLEQWVDQELQGYPDAQKLPEYRRFTSYPRGTYTNGFWTIKNHSVSPDIVDEKTFENMSRLYITAGISELVSKKDDDDLAIPLTRYESIVNYYVQETLQDDYGYFNLHLPVPPGNLSGVISSVRNKLVTILLDMEEIFPSDGDLTNPTDDQIKELSKSVSVNIFNFKNAGNVVLGDNARIDNRNTSISMDISPGSVDELSAFLLGQGLDESDIQEIDPLLGYVYDGNVNSEQEHRLRRWVQDKSSKLASNIGKETAVSLIAQALIQFAPAASRLLQGLV